jgi:hypothetical protein
MQLRSIERYCYSAAVGRGSEASDSSGSGGAYFRRRDGSPWAPDTNASIASQTATAPGKVAATDLGLVRWSGS